MEKRLSRIPVLLAMILSGFLIQLGSVSAVYAKSELHSVSVKDFAEITVSGKVIDTSGNPLIGVTIQVKGTSTGTVTNATGHYQIKADENATLTFSYVGFQSKEVEVNGRTSIDVTLSSGAMGLNELVVVGYGTQKKVNATGAVATIGNDILEDRPVTRLSQALQGTVANLNIRATGAGGAPNATQSINIRGYTGLGATQGPLIVIDGIQGADINSINPNDIET